MAEAPAPGAPRPWDVRPAEAADLPGLADLLARCLAEPWSEAQLRAELERTDARSWVVPAPDGAPLGALGARTVLDELQVLYVAVDPPWRRRGAGRALVERALGEAAAAGARAALLEVRDGNGAARRLYARLGFVAVGRRPRYYRAAADGAAREDALLMTRVLA